MERKINRIVSDRRAVLFGLLIVLMLAANVPAQVTFDQFDWVTGDVFVGSASGNYQVWHSANPLDNNAIYTKEQTINDNLSGLTAGCGFDSAYRFFGTNLTKTKVDRYSIANAHGIVQEIPNLSTGSSSQSVAFDSGPNLYIGYATPTSTSSGTIEKWVKNTTTGLYAFGTSFSVTVDNTGPGWIDLAKDGQTIFYTSQSRKIYKFDGSTSTVWADLSTLNGPNSVGTLFAIKILGPNYDGTSGVLVADQTNVKLVMASNGVITSVQVFTFGKTKTANLQALSLDPRNSSTFWVGDATSNNFFRFDMSTGTTITLTTGTGTTLGGICVDGGFNGAQLAFQPSTPIPNFQTGVLNFKAATKTTPAIDTLSFTSPFTGEILTATLPNLTNNVTVTIRDSLVDPSVALSDPTVFSFNPGAPAGQTVPGNMTCDQTLTTLAGFLKTCEVLAFEANPNSGFSLPNIILETGRAETTPNLRLLSNLDEDGTDGVVDYPLNTRNCVLTVNQQTSDPTVAVLCPPTPLSPADGTIFTKKGGTSTITFSLDVAAPGQCGSNSTTPTGLLPLLMIVQLQPTVNGVTPAPVSIPVLIAGKSGGPPVMVLSGNTYQLQVKTTDIPSGFTYLATVIDLTGTIPSVSSHFMMQ